LRVRLVNVGRDKVTREVEIPDGSTRDQVAQEIAEEAQKHLISTVVWCAWNGKKGTIHAGFHSVGEAELVR